MSSRFLFLLISVILTWILAFNSGRDLAFSISYLVSAILILSYLWAWFSVRWIDLRRLTRVRSSQVGQFMEEQFEIVNRSRIPKLWLEIEDLSALPWHEASRVVSGLRMQSGQRWHVKTLCTQRGRFRLGPMTLRSGDPLGIFEFHEHMPEISYIVVYPLTVDLAAFQPSIANLSGGEARRRRTEQITTNVTSIRDYVPGDSLNRIHWPTTARTQRLMTKEFELDPTADIWVYLDLYKEAEFGLPWTPTRPEFGIFGLRRPEQDNQDWYELPPITTEYIVSVAASLSRYFLMKNRAVGMNSRGIHREFLQSDRGERQLGKILETLAMVEANGDLPFAHMIATEGIRLNRNDTILAVSADPDPAWARALQEIQRRGVNSMAVVVDGGTFGQAKDYTPLLGSLEASGIPVYTVSRGQPLEEALGRPAKMAKAHQIS